MNSQFDDCDEKDEAEKALYNWWKVNACFTIDIDNSDLRLWKACWKLRQQYISELESQRDRSLEALEECVQDLADWGTYASDYFQEKHNLQGDIEKYRLIVAEIKGAKNA